MYEPIILNKQQKPQIESKTIDFDLIEKYRVKISDEVPMPEIILSILDENGQNKRMVMTRQNISCATAQAKVGKSFFIKLITSACITKGVFQNRFNSEMPDGRDNILYIDTEQSKYHVQLGLKQIQILTNNNKNIENKLDVYQFDAVGTDDRFLFVKSLIYTKKYSLVIIDGISDLTVDTNDLKLADKLVTELRIWATECDCHITNVIHLNPGDLSTKMKGHLGTKLADKSEIVFGISVEKTDENIKLVKSLATRNQKPEPFAFEINENGIPKIIDYQFENQNSSRTKRETIVSKKDLLIKHKNEIIELCFKSKTDNRLTYSTLIDFVKREFLSLTTQTLGDNYAKDFIKNCVETNKIAYIPHEKKYIQGDLLDF